MVELVIFDCDGVLVDSELLAARVLSEALDVLGFTMPADEVLDAFVGLDAPSTHRKLEDVYGVRLPSDFGELVAERLGLAYDRRLERLPGIVELLQGLDRPYCIASNSGHERLRQTFAATGLTTLVEGKVFSADDVAHGKPAPDLFLHAARVMGVAPECCLVVEDSVTGVTAARSAGMRVVGYCGGGHIRPGHDQRLLSLGAEGIFTHHRELAASPLLLRRLPALAGA